MLGLLSFISIICCWILLALPITPMIKLMAILCVVASSLYFILRDALLMLPWSWQTLALDIKGRLTMTNQRGLQAQPVLADHTFIHAKLTILNFKRAGIGFGLPPVILFTDLANTDEVRRLRFWLRWASQHSKQTQDNLEEDLAAVND